MPSTPPPSLAAACHHAFDARTRARGERYAAEGRLIDWHAAGDHACSHVRGSRRTPYYVALNLLHRERGTAAVFACDCPVGETGTPCKHMWALLLGRRGTQHLPAPRGPVLVAVDDGFDIPTYPPRGIDRATVTALRHALDELVDADDDPFTDEPWTREPEPDEWRRPLAGIERVATADRLPAPLAGVGERSRIQYLIRADQFEPQAESVAVHFARQKMTRKGWGALRLVELATADIAALVDPADRAACEALLGPAPARPGVWYGPAARVHAAWVHIPGERLAQIMPLVAATGNLCASTARSQTSPLVWDGDEPHVPHLRLEPLDDDGYRLELFLVRGDERLAAAAVSAVPCRELAVVGDRLLRLARGHGGAAWLAHYDQAGPLEIPADQLAPVLEQLSAHSAVPRIELPDGAGWSVAPGAPVARARFEIPAGHRGKLRGRVEIVYGPAVIAAGAAPEALIFDAGTRTVVRRDLPAEAAALACLRDLPVVADARGGVTVERDDFPAVIAALVDHGWQVEAEGKPLRRAGAFSSRVHSGIDWFDLEVSAEFDGVAAELPALLEAVRTGSRFVELGDGSRGLLPADWLARFGALAGADAGADASGRLRFTLGEAAILDALLAALPAVDVDGQFAAARDRIRTLAEVAPRSEPRGFRGELRQYQREGLAWLWRLRELGFGGCLADDMGLGKTIQVLALVAATRDNASGPVLIVAPRSLIHNWLDEAERFTPGLTALDYTGPARKPLRDRFAEADLVLTTYGTVRRDAAWLADQRFDTAVLDEAQAIKNAGSQAAKACRLLRADHRLVLTGTPVENSLSDLMSLFEFLNPGMLGRSELVRRLAAATAPEHGQLSLLARALRPFLLRRTKEQVLTDLPDKTEQVIACKLSRPQRKLYDQLRDHYRASLAQKVEQAGLGRSKIHVLEALLRLRQAACHPGLVDRERASESSAKIDALVERLSEITAAGHKALVFSQFTTLLRIVRDRLDELAITYEYLDGRTRKRKDKVDRFQTDRDCHVFLISLKAGGSGLNLTAADYVFLLDPWWNPAVEAQAIDRAHRIGQTRPVVAYRLITEDTVEDKIVALQRDKRELADGLFAEDAGVLSRMTADDLSLLLS